MALNTLKCNNLTPLGLKGLNGSTDVNMIHNTLLLVKINFRTRLKFNTFLSTILQRISFTPLTHAVMTRSTRTPVNPTGVYPHMPIAVTANSLLQWPSPTKLLLTAYTVCGCPASLLHRANDHRTCYQFFNFWPWGPKLAKRGDDPLSA